MRTPRLFLLLAVTLGALLGMAIPWVLSWVL